MPDNSQSTFPLDSKLVLTPKFRVVAQGCALFLGSIDRSIILYDQNTVFISLKPNCVLLSHKHYGQKATDRVFSTDTLKPDIPSIKSSGEITLPTMLTQRELGYSSGSSAQNEPSSYLPPGNLGSHSSMVSSTTGPCESDVNNKDGTPVAIHSNFHLPSWLRNDGPVDTWRAGIIHSEDSAMENSTENHLPNEHNNGYGDYPDVTIQSGESIMLSNMTPAAPLNYSTLQHNDYFSAFLRRPQSRSVCATVEEIPDTRSVDDAPHRTRRTYLDRDKPYTEPNMASWGRMSGKANVLRARIPYPEHFGEIGAQPPEYLTKLEEESLHRMGLENPAMLHQGLSTIQNTLGQSQLNYVPPPLGLFANFVSGIPDFQSRSKETGVPTPARRHSEPVPVKEAHHEAAPQQISDQLSREVQAQKAFEENYAVIRIGFNPTIYNVAQARYFVIKSFNEADVYASLKHGVWASTQPGNRRLGSAYNTWSNICPILLFFSVNGSGHFCGVAQMTSEVDLAFDCGVWTESRWKGRFEVKWIYVKDVPSSALRHIRVCGNENKPVNRSRDTQELMEEAGRPMLQVFAHYKHVSGLLDTF